MQLGIITLIYLPISNKRRDLKQTLRPRTNARNVYFELGPVDPAFIRGTAFNRGNTVYKSPQSPGS